MLFSKKKIKTEIVAEIGIAHGGQLNTALEMVQKVKECGADTAIFQFYYPDTLCLSRNNFDVYKILDKNKMRPQWIPILKEACDKVGLEFLCTSFCRYSAEAIEPYVKRFKIASPEVCNLELLKHVANYGKPLILSTGRVTQEQLDRIFKEIDVPITLLLCVSKYPALPSDYDLKEMDRLRRKYQCDIGLSDHTKGIQLSAEASEKGASIIERHFALDNNCIDTAVSLLPNDFKKMCEIIRRIK